MKPILGVNNSGKGAQGTRAVGYQELAPYSCKNCIHKTAPNERFCMHPKVIADPEMKDRLIVLNSRTVAEIDLERGCCEYVNQSAQ